MNARVLKVVCLSGLVALFAAGCRTAPVYNVDQAQVVTSAGKNIPANEVKKAIIRAGSRLGWAIRETEQGKLQGTLNLRKHMALVDISYGGNHYSINYNDSRELNYDSGNIHPNYNGWVQNLERAINTELYVQ